MIHLDAKTDFSMMRGFGTPSEWHTRALELGVGAFGIADYASTWGHIPFSKAFTDVKLLLGVQVPVVDKLFKDQKHALVTLIAKSDQGLQMIYERMTLAYQQRYYRPRLTWAQLGDLKGHVELIVNECSIGDFVDFEKLGFGYVAAQPSPGAMRHAFDEFPIVAAISPTFPEPKHREGYELIRSVADARPFGDGGGGGYHMLRRSELEAMWQQIGLEPKEEWFENAGKIADGCVARVQRASNIKPRVEDTLDVLAAAGAKARGISLEGAYGLRLQRELSIIRDKAFDDYFLFVADVVAWAKERMFVGPCRGSSGGSLLCYLLGITELDPLKYGTLFERFLDISRDDWPDIDIDFPDTKRDLVFEYLRDKYGEDHVARLGTISKFGGKSAINDTGKAVGLAYNVTRDVANGYEDGPLTKFFEAPPDSLKPVLDEHPAIKKASLLDGRSRHTGVHAAGVCVTNEPITHYGVVDHNGTLSMDMKVAEGNGLLKLDALGLRTLSVIEDCCEQADIKPDLLYRLSYDDDAVFGLFNRDHVTGVFQFEGTAVRTLMRQITVEKFDDLCALTSLARPGPLVGGAAANWTKRRSGEVDFEYAHSALEETTADTFGTIVYQEQAMAIVRSLGEFDDVEVNGFRRAVGKKDPVALGGYRGTFLDSAIDKMGEDEANELWDEMCEFGSYAFNKSHAVAYSMISYQCAYLKLHFPKEYAIAQLRNAASEEQGKALLRELVAEGHAIVPFDHRRSEADWSIQDGKLIGGFTAVKGVGHKTAATLMRIREEEGENWLDTLTPAQRDKLTKEFNTPWDDLNRRGKMYAHLYEAPDLHGIAGPILTLDMIPEERGNYCFIATLTRRQPRTKDDGTQFLNLYWEDDTGNAGSTISRFKYPTMGVALMEIPDAEGRDFLVRATIINDGRKWFFIDKFKELDDNDRRDKRTPADAGTSEAGTQGSVHAQQDHGEASGTGQLREDDHGAG